jgi:hypothetical protein
MDYWSVIFFSVSGMAFFPLQPVISDGLGQDSGSLGLFIRAQRLCTFQPLAFFGQIIGYCCLQRLVGQVIGTPCR